MEISDASDAGIEVAGKSADGSADMEGRIASATPAVSLDRAGEAGAERTAVASADNQPGQPGLHQLKEKLGAQSVAKVEAALDAGKPPAFGRPENQPAGSAGLAGAREAVLRIARQTAQRVRDQR